MPTVPPIRIHSVNDAPLRAEGEWVLYWMTMARRASYNFGLQRAVHWAKEMDRPLVVLEALRAGYRWASDRLHRFAIDGMTDNAKRFAHTRALHYPYVEPEPGAGEGLLEALARRACVVVTDEFPDFFLPRMVAAAGRKLPVRLEQVDGNGLLPLRAAPKAFTHAYHFRRFLHRELPQHLGDAPVRNPFRNSQLPTLDVLPEPITRRWPPASPELLAGDGDALARLPIDHSVPPVGFRGGPDKATRVLRGFLENRFPRYAEDKNQPTDPANSGLSPYLHWGFISAHRVFQELAEREGWAPEKLAPKPTGKREGWWGMSANAETFLEELVTWREVSYNTSFRMENHDQYESLPAWALKTLKEHADDPRPERFTPEELENAQSYDALWNATQGQLRRDGRIHNYMRILWGKKFLVWTDHPRDALELMIHINNKWALDGRNPNSYSGIFWTLGRYDRAWGPERPVIGKIRPMSSEATARKVRVDEYIRRYAPPAPDGAEDRGAMDAGEAGNTVLPPD